MPEMAGLDEGTPLFVQVADRLAGEIADGGLAEGERVPSTNEMAAFYRINPATAARGSTCWPMTGCWRSGVLMAVAVVNLVNFEHWHVRFGAGRSFGGLTALGLTGVVAGLAVLLLAGGHATIRRATV
jgi:hypothetical protein